MSASHPVGIGHLVKLIGIVTALWQYPLKSALGIQTNELFVVTDAAGTGRIVGDRDWAAVDMASGAVITGKQHAYNALMHAQVLPDPANRGAWQVLALGVSANFSRFDRTRADELLSAAMRRRVQLIHRTELPAGPVRTVRQQLVLDAGTLRDAQPVHLVTTGTISAIERELGDNYQMDVRRLRPNIVVQVPADSPIEHSWVGQELNVGGARLIIRKSTLRCQMVTLPAGDMGLDPRLKGHLKRHHQDQAGIYARIMRGGTLRVGDGVYADS